MTVSVIYAQLEDNTNDIQLFINIIVYCRRFVVFCFFFFCDILNLLLVLFQWLGPAHFNLFLFFFRVLISAFMFIDRIGENSINQKTKLVRFAFVLDRQFLNFFRLHPWKRRNCIKWWSIPNCMYTLRRIHAHSIGWRVQINRMHHFTLISPLTRY